MERTGSIAFDRAVDYYDETRKLTPATEAAMVEAVAGEVRGRGRALEVGVGTGRIALPLRAAGVDATGIDLSLPMLRRLVAKGGGAVPVVQGDATRLPFRDGSFGAAISVHVLHLIPAWREAVAELVRVVRPGGVLLVSQGAWNVVAFEDVIEAFTGAAGMELRHPGLNHDSELDRALEDVGAAARELARIRDTKETTLREMVDSFRDGLFSFTWGLDEATRRSAAGAAATYAEDHHGPLDEVRTVETEMYWRAYDLS